VSRIGKQPIPVPSGVEVEVDGRTVRVKGPKGELTDTFHEDMSIELVEGEVVVERPSDEREHRALHGLTRSLIANMVIGVSEGFEKVLEIHGVGYRAQSKGSGIELQLGLSHPVVVPAPEGISFEVPDQTTVIVRGIDKQQVGQVAAEIRGKRPPEPYKGKGVRYRGEHVRRKVGKTAV
jgi:large subunit ribosomal protein L6